MMIPFQYNAICNQKVSYPYFQRPWLRPLFLPVVIRVHIQPLFRVLTPQFKRVQNRQLCPAPIRRLFPVPTRHRFRVPTRHLFRALTRQLFQAPTRQLFLVPTRPLFRARILAHIQQACSQVCIQAGYQANRVRVCIPAYNRVCMLLAFSQSRMRPLVK